MRPVYRFMAYCLSIFLLMASCASAQVSYPDTHFPSDTPQLFAKGILTDGLSNRDFAISPDGNEILFTIQQPRFALSAILRIVKTKEGWSKPEAAPFSGKYHDLEAVYSPDGKYIYFSSDRPTSDNPAKKDFDIWRVKRLLGGKYGEPENLGPNVNSEKNEFYPCVTKSGNLYFTAELPGGKGSEDIVMCKWTGAAFTKPESLPEDINTKYDEFNAYVDPDERFILFTSYGRPDDIGGGDLYLASRDSRGIWLPVKHLPPPINSSALDYCPYVTPDKKYLIFTSNRLNPAFKDGRTRSYEQMKQLLSGPGNGMDDIYWVKFNPE